MSTNKVISEEGQAQEYRDLVEYWILFGKVWISEIPQILRVQSTGSLYGYALRFAREHRDADKFVEVLEMLIEDAEFVKDDEYLYQYHDYYLGIVDDYIQEGEDYFIENKRFVKFVRKQKKIRPCYYTTL